MRKLIICGETVTLAEGDLEWADSVTGKPKAELLRETVTV